MMNDYLGISLVVEV